MNKQEIIDQGKFVAFVNQDLLASTLNGGNSTVGTFADLGNRLAPNKLPVCS